MSHRNNSAFHCGSREGGEVVSIQGKKTKPFQNFVLELWLQSKEAGYNVDYITLLPKFLGVFLSTPVRPHNGSDTLHISCHLLDDFYSVLFRWMNPEPVQAVLHFFQLPVKNFSVSSENVFFPPLFFFSWNLVPHFVPYLYPCCLSDSGFISSLMPFHVLCKTLGTGLFRARSSTLRNPPWPDRERICLWTSKEHWAPGGFAFCPLIPNLLDETIANARRSLTPQPEVNDNPGSPNHSVNAKGVSSASV